MAKTLFLTLILSLILHVSSAQLNFCRQKRPFIFFWDWHYEYDYKVPVGVSKETIYHQGLKSKDSILEREIFYNKKGLPVIDKQYAAPSREGIISIDSFLYDKNDLLIQTNRHYQNCVLGKVFVTVLYKYDNLGRKNIKIEDGPNSNFTETIYDNDIIIKRSHFPNGSMDTTEIHFYLSGQEDSMQVFRFRKWLYTTEFKYDTLRKTREAFLRHPNNKIFRSRFMYNPDGSVRSLLINNFPNWNNTRLYDVESRIEYNTDKTIRECTFFIKDKKVFVKKHYYEYY